MSFFPSSFNYYYKINPKYTFINNNLTGAVDFIESADILKDQHKSNASTALAIHAMEEFGKAIKLKSTAL